MTAEPQVQSQPVAVSSKVRRRRVLTNVGDAAETARALAAGAVVGHGFANFYVITTRADRQSQRGRDRRRP